MSIFGEGKKSHVPKLLPVAQLAEQTETSRQVLAALTAAYGWTGRTRLQKDNFIRMRDEWLRSPANKEG